MIWLVIILIVIAVLLIRIKRRKYFWKDREGKKLTFRQFMLRFRDGIERTTPLNQTKITLWSYFPIFAGILWGIVVTFLGKTYWLSLLLSGSLPITIIQFLSNWQKYKRFKQVEEEMKKLK